MAGTARFDPENYARYCEQILGALAQGPATANVVAIRLGEPIRRVSWFLGRMARTGHVHIHTINTLQKDGRYRRRLSYARGPGNADPENLVNPKVLPITDPTPSAITPADLEWMAYWKARWDRRRQAVNRDNLRTAA